MTDPVPWPNTTCPVHNNEAACERFRNYLAEATRDVPGIRYADICVPHDSPSYDASVPCEKLGFGPNWLWVHGYFGRYGWRSHAVHHVLHIDKYYSKGRAGSHAGTPHLFSPLPSAGSDTERPADRLCAKVSERRKCVSLHGAHLCGSNSC